MAMRIVALPIIMMITVLTSCVPPSDEITASPSAVDETPVFSSSTGSPLDVGQEVTATSRDWVSELVNLGYLPDAGSTQWIEEMMFKRAPDYCLSSMTDSGDNNFAKLYDRTEFEQNVIRRIGSDGEANYREMKTVELIIQRFCEDRIFALEIIIRLHPMAGFSLSDL